MTEKRRGFARLALASVVAILAQFAPTRAADAYETRAFIPRPPTGEEKALVDPRFYHNYIAGLLAERSGDYHLALERFLRAAEIGADESHILFEKIAALYIRFEDYRAALDAAEAGLEINPDAERLLELCAAIAIKERRYEDAAGYYARLESIRPDFPPYALRRALAIYHSGRKKAGLKQIARIAKKYPDDLAVSASYARLLIADSKFRRAERELKRSVNRHPNDLTPSSALAAFYQSRDRYDDAAAVFEKYIKRNPGSSVARERLIDVYISSGDFDGAIERLDRADSGADSDGALELKIAAARLKLAESVSSDKKLFELALEDFQRVREKRPDDDSILVYIAYVLEKLERYRESVATLDQIRSPTSIADRAIQLKVAELRSKTGDDYNALKTILDLLRNDPDDHQLNGFAGSLNLKMDRARLAVKYFERAIELEPDNPEYHFRLGVALERERRIDESIAAMSKVIQLDPDRAAALNYIGYIYATQGIKLGEAERLLKRALTIEPDNEYYIDSLAWVYFKQRRFKEALELSLRAANDGEPNRTAFEHLGDIQKKLGHEERALRAYERALETKPIDAREAERSGALRVKINQLNNMRR